MLAEFLVLAALPGLLVAAACWDVASFTIPNFLQAGMLALFAALAIAVHMSWPVLGLHLAAGGIGLAAGFTLFALGYIGGGDAKLFAVTALALGLHDLLEFALVASLFGGALTLGLLTMRKLPMPRVLVAQGWIMRLHDDKEGIPYGVALALGALVILPYTELFRAAIAG
ncbi:MAG: A24 family peptidase [Rhizomicrobium sp.]